MPCLATQICALAHYVPEIAAEKWPVWPMMMVVCTSTTLAHMSSKTPIDPIHPFSNESLSFLDTHLIIIGPESDHWECLSLTNSLTHSCLVNLIDVTLACEDANSKIVEVVTVADVIDEDRVGNSLLQIWKLRFSHKA